MTTYGYTAKAVLFDRLEAYAAPAQPLAGLQVSYAWPGQADPECLYGGGIRFEQHDAVAEAPGILVTEDTLVTVYIRVIARPPGDVRDTDARAATIGSKIGALLRAEPQLAGGGSVIGIARGQGDYSQTDDETTSILSYQIRVSTNISYGAP